MKKLAIKHFSTEDYRVLYHGGGEFAIVVGQISWAGLLHKIRDHHKRLYQDEHDIKDSDYLFQVSYRRGGKVYWENWEFPPKIRNEKDYVRQP